MHYALLSGLKAQHSMMLLHSVSGRMQSPNCMPSGLVSDLVICNLREVEEAFYDTKCCYLHQMSLNNFQLDFHIAVQITWLFTCFKWRLPAVHPPTVVHTKADLFFYACAGLFHIHVPGPLYCISSISYELLCLNRADFQ